MKHFNIIVRVLLLSILFVYPSLTKGQASEGDFDTWSLINNPIKSPPPTVSALGKYVEIPVSLYTGIPKIDIPLYNIEVKNYSLPISLSYHASGVKVSQRAGNLGLGWSLQAGGAITRVVKGTPDDKDSVLVYPDKDYVGKLFKDEQFNAETSDLESDLYYFNFNGHSGKFYFDKDNEIAISGQGTPLKIEYEGDISGIGIPRFVITTLQGLLYVFDSKEVVIDIPMHSKIQSILPEYSDVTGFPFASTTNLIDEDEIPYFRYISSWYLSKIIFPGRNDSIEFDYQKYKYNYVERTGVRQRRSYAFCGAGMHIHTSYKASLIDGLFLSKISFNNGYVEFSPDTASSKREDIYYTGTDIWNEDRCTTYDNYEDYYGTEWFLDKVCVYNNADTKIKEYALKHNYFTSTGYDTVTVDDFKHLYKRLRLDSIQEISTTTIPPYIFDYDTSTMLPCRQDEQVDFWGYYNANGSNFSIPKIWIYPMEYEEVDTTVFRSAFFPMPLSEYGTDTTIIDGADRTPDASVNQAWTLKRVTYPMGGSDEFTYETNKYLLGDNEYLGGGLRVKKIASIAAAGDTARIMEYCYEDSAGNCSGRLTNFPLFATYGMGWVSDPDDLTEKSYIRRHNVSQCDLGTTQGSIVGYKDIKVYHRGNGRTEYTYSMPVTLGETEYIDPSTSNVIYKRHKNELFRYYGINDSLYSSMPRHDHFPFVPDPDFDWARGQLLKSKIFDKDGNLLKMSVNEYCIEDYHIDTMAFHKDLDIQTPTCDINGPIENNYQTFNSYTMLSGWSSLRSNKEYLIDPFTSFDTVVKETLYSYTNDHLLRKKCTLSSNGDTLKTIYTYSSDETNEPYLKMVDDYNLISYPTKTASYKESAFLESRSTEYKDWASGSYAPQYQKQKIGSNPEDTILEFHNYDSGLNPISLSKMSDERQSYIWGYDTIYPIAQVINAEPDEIFYTSFEESGGTYSSTAKSGKNIKTLSDVFTINKAFKNGTYLITYHWRASSTSAWMFYKEINTYSGSDLSTYMSWGQIDELRVHPVNAQMTTYTYEPLVGMTSQTDSNGQTTYYEYDDVGRLVKIKDTNSDLLQMIEYNYATQ